MDTYGRRRLFFDVVAYDHHGGMVRTIGGSKRAYIGHENDLCVNLKKLLRSSEYGNNDHCFFLFICYSTVTCKVLLN